MCRIQDLWILGIGFRLPQTHLKGLNYKDHVSFHVCLGEDSGLMFKDWGMRPVF